MNYLRKGGVQPARDYSLTPVDTIPWTYDGQLVVADQDAKTNTQRWSAFLIVKHLYGVTVNSIDARIYPAEDSPLLSMMPVPQDCDQMPRLMCSLLLARAAGHAVSQRKPDSVLIGFCDIEGRILSTQDEIVQFALKQCLEAFCVSSDDLSAVAYAHASGIVAHFYASIVELTSVLLRTPIVQTSKECGKLIDDIIRHNPVNSIAVKCNCHNFAP